MVAAGCSAVAVVVTAAEEELSAEEAPLSAEFPQAQKQSTAAEAAIIADIFLLVIS